MTSKAACDGYLLLRLPKDQTFHRYPSPGQAIAERQSGPTIPRPLQSTGLQPWRCAQLRHRPYTMRSLHGCNCPPNHPITRSPITTYTHHDPAPSVHNAVPARVQMPPNNPPPINHPPSPNTHIHTPRPPPTHTHHHDPPTSILTPPSSCRVCRARPRVLAERRRSAGAAQAAVQRGGAQRITGAEGALRAAG